MARLLVSSSLGMALQSLVSAWLAHIGLITLSPGQQALSGLCALIIAMGLATFDN